MDGFLLFAAVGVILALLGAAAALAGVDSRDDFLEPSPTRTGQL
jgi:hypothetical protein